MSEINAPLQVVFLNSNIFDLGLGFLSIRTFKDISLVARYNQESVTIGVGKIQNASFCVHAFDSLVIFVRDYFKRWVTLVATPREVSVLLPWRMDSISMEYHLSRSWMEAGHIFRSVTLLGVQQLLQSGNSSLFALVFFAVAGLPNSGTREVWHQGRCSILSLRNLHLTN